MGMIGNYLRVSKEELESYIADSSILEVRVYDEEYLIDENLIDVDKTWEGLFFILTGQSFATAEKASPPLLWTLIPPQVIDPDLDMGYGPATYSTVEQTMEVSTAINKISIDEVKNRFNGKVMKDMEIYPGSWDDIDSLEFLIENFILLKDFYNRAAAEKQAVIIFLN
jgi:hypothetical protein